MANSISDFMADWLNKTYAYLKETGGGPTYPPKRVTVGPGVLPTGGYSLVEDVGITEIPITQQFGSVPLPFNPNATGIPATANSQGDVVNELARENPTPPVISSNFQRLYSAVGMSGCINDQKNGHNNPNAASACQKLADSGDVSEMILNPAQKELLGLLPPEQNAKSDEVQRAENEASLTGQIKTGVQETLTTWKGFALGAGSYVKRDPSGNKTIAGDPAGNNFQSLNDRLKAFFPGIPSVPNLSDPLIMIGGGVILVVLLIALVK